METFNSLNCFTLLSKRLENSKTIILSQLDNRFSYEDESPEKITNDLVLEETFSRRRSHNLTPQKKEETLQLLDVFSQYLHLSRLQTAVFVALYTCQLEDFDRSFADCFSRFFDISTLESLPLKLESEDLVKKGYLHMSRTRRRSTFKIDSTLEHAIIDNTEFKLSPAEEIDRYRFCQMVSDQIEKRDDDEISTDELFESVFKMEEENKSLGFIKKLRRKVKSIEARTLFYEICDDHILGGISNIDKTLSDIYESTSQKFKVASAIMSDKHQLQKLNLTEKTPSSFFSGAGIGLTEEGKELLLEKDYELVQKSKDNDARILSPENINTKQLFYGEELKKQIDFLQKSLTNEQFKKLQKKLQEKSLPNGVAAIFYGAPGTGKTETALQIAKATGRKIFHVDISATKTCWYGESEKLVKKIFTDYNKICKKERQKPILLFNEADAVFGKRREDIRGSVDQTDNTIQNILLEEMEKLNGIMIATTNLADNLDDAFERRFLFKVKFDKPTIEAKQNIWKNKLPTLNDDDCLKLAQKFDFSGGEIDNIVRKSTMKEILEDSEPTYELIENLCLNERLNKKGRKKVGY